MVALRNILAHEYGEIGLDRIWAICIGNLPELRDQLESLIPPIDDNGVKSKQRIPQAGLYQSINDLGDIVY